MRFWRLAKPLEGRVKFMRVVLPLATLSISLFILDKAFSSKPVLWRKRIKSMTIEVVVPKSNKPIIT